MPIDKTIRTEEENQFLRNIGFRIQYLRKKCGLSQQELAERADMSHNTIGHLESTSAYGMSIITIFKIAKALDVTPDQLLKFD